MKMVPQYQLIDMVILINLKNYSKTGNKNYLTTTRDLFKYIGVLILVTCVDFETTIHFGIQNQQLSTSKTLYLFTLECLLIGLTSYGGVLDLPRIRSITHMR